MDHQEEPQQVQYPMDPDSYVLLKEIGRGVNTAVYMAHCREMDSLETALVALKCIDLTCSRSDMRGLPREPQTMYRLSHPNVLGAYCSFTVEDSLWVVMPLMCEESLQCIMLSSFPDGFSERCIAVILQQTLSGLEYLHMQEQLHRDIKAANIFIDSNGTVKLADFPVSASVYEATAGAAAAMLADMAWKPYWIAPEVVHSPEETHSWTPKADIWSFGIIALELAHGRPPLSQLSSSKSVMMKLRMRFRVSNHYEKTRNNKDKKFSKSFKDMVGLCLNQDPSKRPSARELLSHPFFGKCKGPKFLVNNTLPDTNGSHRVEPWLQKLGSTNKSAEEEAGNEDEELLGRDSPKQRTISGWNFNKDIFELEPIFQTTTELAPNGETTIPDRGAGLIMSSPEKAKGDGQRELEPSGQDGGTEIFELEPIFKTTTELVPNRFGEETINPDNGPSLNTSSPEKAKGDGQREVEPSEQNGDTEIFELEQIFQTTTEPVPNRFSGETIIADNGASLNTSSPEKPKGDGQREVEPSEKNGGTEIFELEPIFQTTTELVPNRFGGETIISDNGTSLNMSLPEKPIGDGQRGVEPSGQDGGTEKSLMLEGLMALKKSLDVQSRNVARLIALLTGEKAEDERVEERLKTELENMKIKNSELENQLNSSKLNFLRSQLSIARSLISDTLLYT